MTSQLTGKDQKPRIAKGIYIPVSFVSCSCYSSALLLLVCPEIESTLNSDSYNCSFISMLSSSSNQIGKFGPELRARSSLASFPIIQELLWSGEIRNKTWATIYTPNMICYKYHFPVSCTYIYVKNWKCLQSWWWHFQQCFSLSFLISSYKSKIGTGHNGRSVFRLALEWV